jgi:hypothetical protein
MYFDGLSSSEQSFSSHGGGHYQLHPHPSLLSQNVDYFTKWEETMPMFSSDGETTMIFVFNQVIARFEVPKDIITDHGSHFQNNMMLELASKLGFR